MNLQRGFRVLAGFSLVVVAVTSACSGGVIGTVNTDVGRYTVTDVEAGQLDVTSCQGTKCTINRDGVLFSKREILVILEPEAEVTDISLVTASDFANACAKGGLFVSDGVNSFGCESFSIGEDGGVAIVFSNDICPNCPDEGFEGDLVLIVAGNDPLPLQ